MYLLAVLRPRFITYCNYGFLIYCTYRFYYVLYVQVFTTYCAYSFSYVLYVQLYYRLYVQALVRIVRKCVTVLRSVRVIKLYVLHILRTC